MALDPVGDSLWLAEGGLVSFYGFPYPTRSVIARLENGGLWVWSPVALTDELQAEVEALGSVAHLVSPNKLHYLYLRQWQQVWPEAKLWGPASTLRKCRDLDFEAPLTDEAPAPWQGQIDQFWFRGSSSSTGRRAPRSSAISRRTSAKSSCASTGAGSPAGSRSCGRSPSPGATHRWSCG
jgi:hypothetical protein